MKYFIFLFLAITTFSATAQELPKNFNQIVQDIEPQLIKWRRHFHENPELSNREFNTGKYIADYLKTLGIEVHYPVAKTGVVAILKGGKPGPVVALRADIDALPVQERTPVPFASKVKTEFMGQTVDVMHACGHDSHISILMATAKVLQSMQKEVPGTVVFLFQPAEEGAPGTEEGGAPLMIKEGALDQPKVEAVFGLHIEADLPVGNIYYKQGAFMASSDWFTIKVNGKGSHGSQPWGGVDPIASAAQIIEGLQHIVSRTFDISSPTIATTAATHKRVGKMSIPHRPRGNASATDGTNACILHNTNAAIVVAAVMRMGTKNVRASISDTVARVDQQIKIAISAGKVAMGPLRVHHHACSVAGNRHGPAYNIRYVAKNNAPMASSTTTCSKPKLVRHVRQRPRRIKHESTGIFSNHANERPHAPQWLSGWIIPWPRGKRQAMRLMKLPTHAPAAKTKKPCTKWGKRIVRRSVIALASVLIIPAPACSTRRRSGFEFAWWRCQECHGNDWTTRGRARKLSNCPPAK